MRFCPFVLGCADKPPPPRRTPLQSPLTAHQVTGRIALTPVANMEGEALARTLTGEPENKRHASSHHPLDKRTDRLQTAQASPRGRTTRASRAPSSACPSSPPWWARARRRGGQHSLCGQPATTASSPLARPHMSGLNRGCLQAPRAKRAPERCSALRKPRARRGLPRSRPRTGTPAPTSTQRPSRPSNAASPPPARRPAPASCAPAPPRASRRRAARRVIAATAAARTAAATAAARARGARL